MRECVLHALQANMGFVLVIGTFISYCGAIAVIGAIYKFWAPHPTCGLNIFFITFTLVLALIFTLISVSPWRLETAGLLTSGVVFLYCAWICWSALASEPDDARCTYQGGRGTTAEKVSNCAKLLLIFSHDRPIVQGYPDGCQHRFASPAEAKALPREGASALVTCAKHAPAMTRQVQAE